MTTQTAKPSRIAQAARVLLTFLLVFGMSFRAEMALAAIEESGLEGHEEKTLTNLTVKAIDGDEIGKAARSLADMKDDKNKDGITLEYGDSVKLAAVPEWEGKEEKAIANFVEWEVDGEKRKGTTVEVANGEVAGGTVTVKCSIPKDDAGAYLADVLDGTREVSFPVTLSPRPVETKKVVGDAKCPLVGKGLDEGANTLQLTKEEGASYQFTAKVHATIYTVDQDNNILDTDEGFTYSSDDELGLSEKSDGLFDDLQWALYKDGEPLDESVATIEGGLLKVSQDSSFTVQCVVSSSAGADGGAVSSPFQVEVTCGNATPEKPSEPEGGDVDQGDARYRQDTLAVTGYIASSAMAGGDTVEGSAEEPDGEGPDSSGADYKPLGKEFGFEDLEGRFNDEGKYRKGLTYQMHSSADGQINVTGEGVALKDLLGEMSVEDFSAIDEVRFIDYMDSAVTLKWSDISSGADSPLVATKSYVSAVGSGSDSDGPSGSGSSSASSSSSSDDGEPSSPVASEAVEPIDNTRFRILFDDAVRSGSSALANADALRYIKEIVINPGLEPEPAPDPEPEPEAPFTVTAGYVPSPIGQQAVFWPIPSKEIAGATFNYAWEESADDGKTWKKVSTDTTYRTITTEERIGHQFRVVLSSDMIDEATGKPYSATSKPVTMVEGSGVSLIYDPPIAGGIAVFTVKFTGFPADFDFGKLEYNWEYSDDGCKSWKRLPDPYQGKSTLSIQTDPIDESAPDENVTPTYIRCRIVGDELKKVLTDEKGEPVGEVVAGPQMLVVQTGRSEGPEAPTPIPAPQPAPQTPPTTDPAPTPTEPSGDVPTETPQDTSGDEPADDAPQLYVDEEVTQQILNQEQAEQEYVESTVPGARWTSLSKSGDDGDDQNVLGDNPFAPFAIPVGLGITAAGGLEKLLAFRRQL